MQVITKEKKSLTSIFHIEYMFDTGHKYWVWSDDTTNAYTPSGRYPSKTTKQKMERLISEWESRRTQII
jgi:hypothetical protein